MEYLIVDLARQVLMAGIIIIVVNYVLSLFIKNFYITAAAGYVFMLIFRYYLSGVVFSLYDLAAFIIVLLLLRLTWPKKSKAFSST